MHDVYACRKIVTKTAILAVLAGVLYHICISMYSTDIGADTRSSSGTISAIEQTCHLGRSTIFTDSLLHPTCSTRSGIQTGSDSSHAIAAEQTYLLRRSAMSMDSFATLSTVRIPCGVGHVEGLGSLPTARF